MKSLVRKNKGETKLNYKTVNDNEILYMADEQSNAFLFKKYKPIILATANKYYRMLRNKVLDYEDLVQAGYVALQNCISYYDYERNAVFYTYATHCIQKEIVKEVSRSNRRYSITSAFEHSLESKGDFAGFEYDFDIGLFESDIYDFCLDLDFNSSCIFLLKISGFSYKEIASLLELKVKKVDYTLQKCKNKLKKYLFT